MNEKRIARMWTSDKRENNRLRYRENTNKDIGSQMGSDTPISRGRARERARSPNRRFGRNCTFDRGDGFERNYLHGRQIIRYDDDIFQNTDDDNLETAPRCSTSSKYGDLRLPLSKKKTGMNAKESAIKSANSQVPLSTFQNANKQESGKIVRQPETRKSSRISQKLRNSSDRLKTVCEIEDTYTPRKYKSENSIDGEKQMPRQDRSDREKRYATKYEQPLTQRYIDDKHTNKHKSPLDQEFDRDQSDTIPDEEEHIEEFEGKKRSSSPFSSISEDTSCFSSTLNADDQLLNLTLFRDLQSFLRTDFVAKVLAELISIKVSNEKAGIFTVDLSDFSRCLQNIGIYFESESAFIQILIYLSDYFSYNEMERSIEPRTNVKICEKYTNDINIKDCDCSSLHMCKFFLVGNCMAGERCKFSHEVLEMHNQIVLKSHCLYKLPPQHIIKLMNDVKNRNPTTSPTICKFYNNEGGCSRKQRCQHLHVCKHFVTGDCKFGRCCKRDHDFKSTHSRDILYKFGLELYQYNYEVLFPLINMNMDKGVIRTKRVSRDGFSSTRLQVSPFKARSSSAEEANTIPSNKPMRYFPLDQHTEDNKEIRAFQTQDTDAKRKVGTTPKYRPGNMSALESTKDESAHKSATNTMEYNSANENQTGYRNSISIPGIPLDGKQVIYQRRNVNSNTNQDSNSETELGNKKRKGKAISKNAKRRRIEKVVDKRLSVTIESTHVNDKSTQKTMYEGTRTVNPCPEHTYSIMSKTGVNQKETNGYPFIAYCNENRMETDTKAAPSEKEADVTGGIENTDRSGTNGRVMESKEHIYSIKSESTPNELNKADKKDTREGDANTTSLLSVYNMEHSSQNLKIDDPHSAEILDSATTLKQTRDIKVETNASGHTESKSICIKDQERDSSAIPSTLRDVPSSDEMRKKDNKLRHTIKIKEQNGSLVLTFRDGDVILKISGTSVNDVQDKIESTVATLLVHLKSLRCKADTEAEN